MAVAPPLWRWQPPDDLHAPLNRILTARSRTPNLGAAPNQSSLYRAAAHGGFSAAPQSRGGGEGGRSGGEGEGEGRTGSRTGGDRSRRAAGPPARCPSCRRGRRTGGNAVLDCRVAAGLQAKPLDGGTLVLGPRRRSSSSRRRLKPEPLAGVALHHGAGTGPAKGDAAPVYIFTAPFTTLNRLHPSSPSSSAPPRRNAKERGCSTGKMSPWKPWTAPPCFLCSRPFRCSSPPPRRRVRSVR
jgi:hypothetical protein